MKHLAAINKYFYKYKWHFILGIVFVITTNYFRILAPQLTGYIVNDVINTISKNGKIVDTANYDVLVKKIITWYGLSTSNKVFLTGITLLILALLSGFFMFLMRQTLIVMSRHIEFDQKNEIYSKYQQLTASFYKKNFTGDLMNRISEDVSKVRMYTGPAVMYVINLCAIIGFNVYFMLQASVKLTLVALAPLPILAFTIYFVNKIINKKSEQIQKLLSTITTNAQEAYAGIRVIKTFAQEDAMYQAFNSNSQAYKNNAIGLAKVEAIYAPSISLLVGLSTLITIMVGCLDVVNNVPGASVGNITEFVLYIQMLTFPVSAIGWTAGMIQRAAVSQQRINEFLLYSDTKLQDDEKETQPVAFNKNIIFKNVSFTYEHTKIEALKNINLNIPAGQKIAIVGKTGSGKSTLAQLLLNQFNATQGQILYDGVNVNKISSTQLRNQVAFVPQDVFLFSDTVANNIRFYDESVGMERVQELAKLTCVHQDIVEFVNGYQTVVGERGVTLSGGQKQRITIARALIKNSNVLILDDCLSAVDAKTEHEILNNLKTLLQNKTAIIITHRIFSLFEFDQIIVMEDGHIIEQGTHEDLITKNGAYKKLYDAQQNQQTKN
jgi:ATP-binding cassette, subfamily B, multidrug efflux pump